MSSKSSKDVKRFRDRVKEALVISFNSKCFICKNEFPKYVFDFHHLNPNEKSFTICSSSYGIGLEAIKDEAKKCAMLCSNCHRVVEYSGEDFDLKCIFDEELFNKYIENNKFKNGKEVLQFDLDGNLLNSYKSIAEASKAIGKDKRSTNIAMCCNGERLTAYGFKWKFK